MAAFLGAGITHFPRLVGPDRMMADTLSRVLEDPALDPALRDPASWPEQLREEYAEDRGLAAAAEHRHRLVENLRRVRAEIDRFQPDAVIVWGDDQYENFREDCIPPYSVLAYESTVNTPWTKLKRFGPNVWGEPEDTEVRIRGARSIAKELVGGLLGEGIDISYSYEPKHEPGLSHAFLNSVLFLDHDRTGFDYPVIPIAINCYGRKVICQKGGIPSLTDTLAPEDLDPPGPAPWRCFDMGAAIARVLSRTDLRIALIASASWSHGFLAEKNHFLWPDEKADRRLYEAMKAGDFSAWRETSAASVEDAGQHEILNWMALMGAMSELDLKPDWTDLVETYAFNSNKAFALFGSGAGA